jgi:hypothetical protein
MSALENDGTQWGEKPMKPQADSLIRRWRAAGGAVTAPAALMF